MNKCPGHAHTRTFTYFTVPAPSVSGSVGNTCDTEYNTFQGQIFSDDFFINISV